ncbi:hypothetical protein [Micromonospora sp. 050-3]|uniref:hypothetical protein n=1 Tax=Micromonospora sp. 050-3 TaxID=2789265 RepID=UPI003979BBA7
MSSKESLNISWRILAISSLLINIVAIIAVATVASVTNAGALETVALALSILAFACQLIIYSVQTWQSGEQLRQARELNASTLATLSEVQTRIEGTHQMVSVQHQELMHLAALKASSSLRKEAAASENNTVQIESAEYAMNSVAVAVAQEQIPNPRPAGRVAPANRRWSSPIEWPSLEEANSILQVIDDPDLSYNGLAFALADDISADEAGISPGLGYRDVLDDAWIDLGMLALHENNDEKLVKLTPNGRRAGRLLIAPWPPPANFAHIKEDIKRLRERLNQGDKTIIKELRELLDDL